MAARSMRQMRKGERGRISSVNAAGETGRRIRDMGLLPGVEVVMLGCAPLRDPVSLLVRGSAVALRNSEADHVLVESLGAS